MRSCTRSSGRADFLLSVTAFLAAAGPRPRWILIAAERVTDVDAIAAEVLADLDDALNADGISLVFAELKDAVRRKIERYRLTRTIDPRFFYPTFESAIAAFCDETGAGWPPTRARPRHGPLQFIR